MMLCEKLIVKGRHGPQGLVAKERRLALRADHLGTNALVTALASAAMFVIVLGLTRDLAVAVLAGSPAVIALGFVGWALATRLHLSAVRRRLGAPDDGRGGVDAFGMGERSMERAIM
jgi:hypothetical protein